MTNTPNLLFTLGRGRVYDNLKFAGDVTGEVSLDQVMYLHALNTTYLAYIAGKRMLARAQREAARAFGSLNGSISIVWRVLLVRLAT